MEWLVLGVITGKEAVTKEHRVKVPLPLPAGQTT